MSLYELDQFNRKLDRFFGDYESYDSYITLGSNAVDLYENDEAYKVIVELPGVSKEEINIESDAQSISISCSKKDEFNNSSDDVHWKERYSEEFNRKFKFSKFIDPSKASVTLENGILTILLPKSEGSKKVSLSIQ